MENDVLYNRIMKKVAEMIAEAGGGSSLPEVTADDNGDVLTVVSGEWAKAALPASPSGLCVIDDGDLNKSYDDLVSMLSNGVVPYINRNYGTYTSILILCRYEYNSDDEVYNAFFRDTSGDESEAFYASTTTEPMVLD